MGWCVWSFLLTATTTFEALFLCCMRPLPSRHDRRLGTLLLGEEIYAFCRLCILGKVGLH